MATFADTIRESLGRRTPDPWVATYTLGSVTLKASRPREIATQTSFSGFKWFPGLLRFRTTGQLMLLVSENDDSDFNSSNLSRISLAAAADAPAPWGAFYTIDRFRGGEEAAIARADGTIIGARVHSIPNPDDGSPHTAFTNDRITYSNGGLSYTYEAGAMAISGFGTTIQVVVGSSYAKAKIYWDCPIVELANGNWVSAVYCMFTGDSKFSVECIRSTDLGYTWTRIGNIAVPADFAGSSEGFTEPSLRLLANGTLSCVMRTGTGASEFLYQATSTDGGSTWTNPASLTGHAGRKSPRQLVLTDGKVALIAGSDLRLGVSTDHTATWAGYWDPLTHHNLYDLGTVETNTAGVNIGYVGFVETAPNRVAIAYDYVNGGRAAQPNAGPAPNRIYLVEALIT